MIKINLCPIDELQNPYWWIQDVVVAATVTVGAFVAVQYYLGQIQVEIEEVNVKIEEINANEQKLASDLRRYANMEKDEAELQIKLTALQQITVSKITKYKPLIVIEHLANLKPEGVWYHYFKVGDANGDYIELKGQGFDNLLVAELMTALKSTASQQGDESDLRTLVYFDQVMLDQTRTPEVAPRGFPELKAFPEFVIRAEYLERDKSKDKGPTESDLMTQLPPTDSIFRM